VSSARVVGAGRRIAEWFGPPGRDSRVRIPSHRCGTSRSRCTPSPGDRHARRTLTERHPVECRSPVSVSVRRSALRTRWPMAVLGVVPPARSSPLWSPTRGALIRSSSRSPRYTAATRFDRAPPDRSISSTVLLVLAGIVSSGDYLGNVVIIQPIAWIAWPPPAGDAVRIRSRLLRRRLTEPCRPARSRPDEVAARRVAEETATRSRCTARPRRATPHRR